VRCITRLPSLFQMPETTRPKRRGTLVRET
jgi:hypothetical protein